MSEVRSIIVFCFLLEVSAWGGTCPGQQEADACPGRQQAIEILRSRIRADQERIKDLNIGITSSQLDDAVEMSEEGYKKALIATALALVDGILMAPDAALGKQSVAEFRLKNGLGSIGTGPRNAIIGRIRAEGGVKQALIPAIRKLGSISGKTSQLEYLRLLSQAASSLKSVAELGAADNSLEETEALFALAAAIAGRGDVALSLATAVLNSAKNETQIYLMARDIRQLTNTAEAQLKALKVLSANLQIDVQTLQSIRAADNCEGDVTWQIALQNQRIAAAAAGNIGFYNQLLRLHSQIFAEFGLKACDSRYYPGGCSPTPAAKGQTSQGPGSSCPQFSPQNVQDALQVEHASYKNVCWGYEGKTLIATSSETPDKADKPFSSTAGLAPTAADLTAVAGTANTITGTSAADRGAAEVGGKAGSARSRIGKTSHSKWDVGVRYYPAYQGKSAIYVAHLVTKSQVRPQSQGVLQWCSALLFKGEPFTYDTFSHNHNSAILGECTSTNDVNFDMPSQVALEKGRAIRSASGEKVYVAQSRVDVEFSPGPFNPGTYTVVVCPPYIAVAGRIPAGLGHSTDPLTPRHDGTCRSMSYQGPSGSGEQVWSDPIPPIGTFTVNLTPGMSATVTVKTY